MKKLSQLPWNTLEKEYDMSCFVKLTLAHSGNIIVINKNHIVGISTTNLHKPVSQVFCSLGNCYEVDGTVDEIFQLVASDPEKKGNTQALVSSDAAVLSEPISFLRLSNSITWILKDHCAPPAMIADLLRFSAAELVQSCPHVGNVAVEKIRQHLKNVGLALKGE